MQGDNKLGAEGARALAGALEKKTGMQTLDMVNEIVTHSLHLPPSLLRGCRRVGRLLHFEKV